MTKSVTDEKLFMYIASAYSEKNKVSYEKAVFEIQMKIGIDWGLRSVSVILGISMNEVDKTMEESIRKIERINRGYGTASDGQMTMLFRDTDLLEDYEI